jgi:fatty acid desaturase
MDASFAKTIRVEPKRLKQLSQKSDRQGWLQVGMHSGSIALNTIVLLSTWGSAFMVPFFIIQGVLINCLYAGVHELSHNSVFKTRKLNEWFGRLFSFILLMGRDQDKYEHFQHHRYTQDVERDAEIVGGEPFTLKSYLLYVSGITYWPARLTEVVRLGLGRTDSWPHVSEVQFKTVHKEARLMLLAYAFIAILSLVFSSAFVLYVWLLPMMSMKCFHMLQNTAEHTGMPHDDNILLNTRTISANPLMLRLFWNMPYHTAHHTYPMVPFYHLSELHDDIVIANDGRQPETVSHWAFQKHMLRKLRKEGTSKYTGQEISAY